MDSLPSSQVSRPIRSVDWTLTFCRPTLSDDTRSLAGSSTGSAPLTMHFCVSCLPCPTNARPTSQHPCGPCRHILSTMWLLDTYNVYLYKKTQLTTAIKSVNPTGKQKDTTWRQDWLPGSLPAASRITETYYCLVTYFKRDVLASLGAHTHVLRRLHMFGFA